MNAILPLTRPDVLTTIRTLIPACATPDALAKALDARMTAAWAADDYEAAETLAERIPGNFDTWADSLAWAREKAECDLEDEWPHGLTHPATRDDPEEYRDGAEDAVADARDAAAKAWVRDVGRALSGERAGAGCVG